MFFNAFINSAPFYVSNCFLTKKENNGKKEHNEEVKNVGEISPFQFHPSSMASAKSLL
jgi:hypothetical protein